MSQTVPFPLQIGVNVETSELYKFLGEVGVPFGTLLLAALLGAMFIRAWSKANKDDNAVEGEKVKLEQRKLVVREEEIRQQGSIAEQIRRMSEAMNQIDYRQIEFNNTRNEQFGNLQEEITRTGAGIAQLQLTADGVRDMANQTLESTREISASVQAIRETITPVLQPAIELPSLVGDLKALVEEHYPEAEELRKMLSEMQDGLFQRYDELIAEMKSISVSLQLREEKPSLPAHNHSINKGES